MKHYINCWKKYIDFKGRASRAEYWYFALFHFIVYLTLAVIDTLLGLVDEETGYGLFTGLYYLAALLPGLAVAVRRMHDTEKSGWFILVPFYNLILALTPGNAKANKYGPDPYAKQVEEIK